MKYIADCQRKNGEFELIFFGFTEKHYIKQNFSDDDRYTLGMMHIWKSYTSFGEYNYYDKKFDPSTEEWEFSSENIFDSFDEAKSYFFKQLFNGE